MICRSPIGFSLHARLVGVSYITKIFNVTSRLFNPVLVMHEDPPVLPLEVLELILLQLDLRTLLVAATCVCHAWAELIRDSPAIQRRLFFAPDPDIQPSAPIHCALLADAFPSVFVYHRTGAFWEDDLGDPTRQFSVKSWDLILHPNRQPAYLRPEASWRRMLVQQPPIYKLGVWFEQYSPHVSAQEYHEIPVSSSKFQFSPLRRRDR